MLTLALTSFAHTEPHLRAHPAVTRRCCTTRRYALRSSPPLQTRALGPTRARVPRRAGLLLPPLQAQAAAAATATAATAATAVRVGAHGARRARSGGQRRIGPARRTRPQRGRAEVHTHAHTDTHTWPYASRGDVLVCASRSVMCTSIHSKAPRRASGRSTSRSLTGSRTASTAWRCTRRSPTRRSAARRAPPPSRAPRHRHDAIRFALCDTRRGTT